MMTKYLVLISIMILTIGIGCGENKNDEDKFVCPNTITPEEVFVEADAPNEIVIDSYTFSTPWGYEKAENADRKYPIVVHTCWDESAFFTEDIKKENPSFFVSFQHCSSDSDGVTLAQLIDQALDQDLRIDMTRIYLTGFSMGGSGSYRLVRGFHSENKFFAGIIRVAGQSQTELADEVIAKTSVWYHLGLLDEPVRVEVAQDSYAFIKDHSYSIDAEETSNSDTIEVNGTYYPRFSRTLTKNNVEYFKLTEYENVGHYACPQAYAEPKVFQWLFSQSTECR